MNAYGAWASRESWTVPPEDPAACRVNTERLAASENLVAFQTCASVDKNVYDQLIHVWQRKGGELREVGRHPLSNCDAVFVDGDSVWLLTYSKGLPMPKLVELVVVGDALQEARTVPDVSYVVAGRFLSYGGGTLKVRASGGVQRLEVGDKRAVRGLIAAEGDRLVIIVGEENEQKPRTLFGFRWDGAKYVPWFERKNPHIGQDPRITHPKALAFAGNSLILGFDHAGIRRLSLPPM